MRLANITRAAFLAVTFGLLSQPVLADAKPGAPEVILMASGSELSLCVEAFETLKRDGVAARLVSFPSWELFAAQSDDYRASVLGPEGTKRLSVEAGTTIGWQRFATASVGVDRFGESGPGTKVLERYGFTVDNVYNAATALLSK